MKHILSLCSTHQGSPASCFQDTWEAEQPSSSSCSSFSSQTSSALVGRRGASRCSPHYEARFSTDQTSSLPGLLSSCTNWSFLHPDILYINEKSLQLLLYNTFFNKASHAHSMSVITYFFTLKIIYSKSFWTRRPLQGKGRRQYLQRRGQMRPEEKFDFPLLSSWEYGWRLGEFNHVSWQDIHFLSKPQPSSHPLCRCFTLH